LDGTIDASLKEETTVLVTQVLWALATDHHRQLAHSNIVQHIDDTGSKEALMCACAMGLVSHDMTLAAATLEQLIELDVGVLVDGDVLHFLSVFYTLHGQDARATLSKWVMCRPQSSHVWSQLAQMLYNHNLQEYVCASAAALCMATVEQDAAKMAREQLRSTREIDRVRAAFIAPTKSFLF
jgi:hypothetical protein